MSKIKDTFGHTGIKCMYAVMKCLIENGGVCASPIILTYLKENVEFNYWESEIKGSSYRWWVLTQSYSSKFTKAGLIVKQNKVWTITPDGIEAFKLGAENMMELVDARLRENRANAKRDKS